MARQARVKSSTGEYIILLRGNDEQLFKEKRFRDIFSELCEEKLGDGLLGIRFFNDSVTVVVKESEKGISIDMKPILISFARAYNRENANGGKVFKDRFKSLPIEDDSFKAECMAYIDGRERKNPFEPKNGARAAAGSSKKAVKVKEKEDKEEIKEESRQPEPQKNKRRNDMPTWLL